MTCVPDGMTLTQKIMQGVVDHLQSKIPDLAIEYFPDKPSEYRLNHAKGVLLLSYGKSTFSQPHDTGSVVQARELQLTITSMVRSLNGRVGVIAVLDQLRLAIIGYTPPSCRRKIYAVSEDFLGENAGIWSYQTTIATETFQIED